MPSSNWAILEWPWKMQNREGGERTAMRNAGYLKDVFYTILQKGQLKRILDSFGFKMTKATSCSHIIFSSIIILKFFRLLYVTSLGPGQLLKFFRSGAAPKRMPLFKCSRTCWQYGVGHLWAKVGSIPSPYLRNVVKQNSWTMNYDLYYDLYSRFTIL